MKSSTKSPFGRHEDNTLEQAKVCSRHAEYFALTADGRLGYGVPIGGVIAAEGRISPTAVGFDIACGNKAVRLDLAGAEVLKNIQKIMDDIWQTLSFGVRRKNPERNSDSPSVTDTHVGWNTEAAKPSRHKANAQFEMIGSGSRYMVGGAQRQKSSGSAVKERRPPVRGSAALLAEPCAKGQRSSKASTALTPPSCSTVRCMEQCA